MWCWFFAKNFALFLRTETEFPPSHSFFLGELFSSWILASSNEMGQDDASKQKSGIPGVPKVDIPKKFSIGLVIGGSGSGKTRFISSYFGEPENIEWDRYGALMTKNSDAC